MIPPSIYEELIDLIEQAEQNAETGHPVEALIGLGNVRSRVIGYLDGMAN